MAEKLKAYKDWLGGKLADPKRAARYLNSASDDSEAMFLKALRKVALAQDRPMADIAEACGVSRESLYRMLSETGNPTSDNRRAILAALGFKSIVVPIDAELPAREVDSGSDTASTALETKSATQKAVYKYAGWPHATLGTFMFGGHTTASNRYANIVLPSAAPLLSIAINSNNNSIGADPPGSLLLSAATASTSQNKNLNV
jgi:probable addiction module antidote protein